ncbi:hypothetical protein ABW19_dt0201463 [Dactylella cylindrospora]|nr:hypothetical protein ABW19_dt0201463 [Dactylella cylindrospora]
MSQPQWSALQAQDTTPYIEDARSPWAHLPSPSTTATAPTPVKRKPVPYQTLEVPIAQKLDDPVIPARWGLTWQSPALCLCSLLSGIAVAAGNHAYFSRLHNTPYDNVEWVGRYSLVLAIIVKTCFATSLLICYEQVVWMGFKDRVQGTSIRAIDALFGATHQVLSLLRWSMWVSNPMAAIMISLRWLLPLVSIIAPTTLTVQVRETVSSSDCQVPIVRLNLDEADTFESRESVTYLTDLAQFDYTHQQTFPTSLASKVGTLTGFLGEPVSFASPCGSNCSYTLTLDTPLWKCTETDPMDPRSPWERDNSTSAPWASVNKGTPFEYTSFIWYVSATPNDTSTLWVGHVYKSNATADAGTPYNQTYTPETFYCDGHNATLTVELFFMNGEQQTPKVLNIDYGNIVDWSYGSSWAYENNAYPIDPARHRAVYKVLTELLAGEISLETRSGGIFSSDTKILNMPAFVKPNLVGDDDRNDQLKDLIRPLVEELSLNYTLSLLAYSDLVTTQTDNATCTNTIYSNVWKYQPRNLIIAYCAGAALSLVSAILGGFALYKNGLVSEISFSQVLVTTRNPELDDLSKGNCLGKSDLYPRGLYNVNLRLGELKKQDDKIGQSTGAAHVAFGAPDNVVGIRRRGHYV